MKHIVRIMIVLVGLGACALGITMLGTAPAYTQQGAPAFDVNVVNTPNVRDLDNPVMQCSYSPIFPTRTSRWPIISFLRIRVRVRIRLVRKSGSWSANKLACMRWAGAAAYRSEHGSQQ